MTSKLLRNSLARFAAVGCTALMLTGCQFGGLNSLNMPGTAGHDDGAYTITVELPDISSLPQNSPVMVDDVTVGSVSGVQAVQRSDGTFYAAVQLALGGQVHLPANATATIAQTSLLGSQHVALSAPTTEAPVGTLDEGATIPLERAGRYPTTEEVLSSLGVVVNKGNLGALQDITDELYSAVAGRVGQFADFFPRLAELTGALDQQTADIISATEKIDTLAARLARGNDQLARTLDALPAALKVLNDNAGNVVDAFAALKRLGETVSRILPQTKTDLDADLKYAYSIVKALNDNAGHLIDALPALPTFPIPQPGIKNAVRGDYLNAFVTLDFTVRRLGETLFTTSGLDPNMKHFNEVVNPPDFLLGEMANLSGQAADPFKIPPGTAAGGH
jgi:phospholipid/cholesterol/gamma-HCH transport system substrate-binding protein